MLLENIHTVCSLGTGTMGFGTALLFAFKGYRVRMFGRSAASLERGMGSIESALETYRNNGLATDEEVAKTLANITGTSSYEEAVAGAQFVIESIVEDLQVKRQLFGDLERIVEKNVIFATNTSGLSPTAIAAGLAHPGRFVVAHFWNPPHLIPLVEIVPGEKTEPSVVQTVRTLIEKIGKKPVVLQREAPGFIGNRLQFALLREALHIVESGIASPEEVDTAVKYSFARRLGVTGPLESADFGGLDTFLNISSYLNADLSADKEPSMLIRQAVEEGNLGVKTGKGLYTWPQEKLSRTSKNRNETLIEWLKKDTKTSF